MYIPNFNFLAQFGGELGGDSTFLRSKIGGNPISFLLSDLGSWCLNMLYSYRFSIRWPKKNNFCVSDPSAPPPSNWGITEFWPQKVENTKRHILDSYSIYITNFNFLPVFGRELYEEQTREMNKMEKSIKKSLSWDWKGLKWGWKVETPKRHI